MSYRDGKPETTSGVPQGRDDRDSPRFILQYLHRRKSMRPTDEYSKILTAVQHYAIQYAGRGLGWYVKRVVLVRKRPKQRLT
jgi:hypothetical protein